MSTKLGTGYTINAGRTTGDENGQINIPPDSIAKVSGKAVENSNPITRQLSKHVAFKDENGKVVGRAALDEKGNVVLISGELSEEQLNEAKAMLLARDKQPEVEFEIGE